MILKQGLQNILNSFFSCLCPDEKYNFDKKVLLVQLETFIYFKTNCWLPYMYIGQNPKTDATFVTGSFVGFYDSQQV